MVYDHHLPGITATLRLVDRKQKKNVLATLQWGGGTGNNYQAWITYNSLL